jgi:hypothetical protein
MTYMNDDRDYDAGYHFGYGLVWPLDGPAPRKAQTFGRGLYDGVKARKADQKAVAQPGGSLEAVQRLTQAGWFSHPAPMRTLTEEEVDDFLTWPERQAAVRAVLGEVGLDPDEVVDRQ